MEIRSQNKEEKKSLWNHYYLPRLGQNRKYCFAVVYFWVTLYYDMIIWLEWLEISGGCINVWQNVLNGYCVYYGRLCRLISKSTIYREVRRGTKIIVWTCHNNPLVLTTYWRYNLDEYVVTHACLLITLIYVISFFTIIFLL